MYRTALIVVHCRTRNFCHRIIQCGFSPFYIPRTHHTAVHTSVAQPAVPDPISRCGVGYTNMPYTRLCRHILCPWFVKLSRASIIFLLRFPKTRPFLTPSYSKTALGLSESSRFSGFQVRCKCQISEHKTHRLCLNTGIESLSDVHNYLRRR